MAVWGEGIERAEILDPAELKSDYFNMGLGLRNLNRPREAEAWFKKALDVAPKDDMVRACGGCVADRRCRSSTGSRTRARSCGSSLQCSAF